METGNSYPVSKPALWRQLLPWVLAGVILVYVFQKVPFAEVKAALKGVSLLAVIAGFAVYTLAYYLTDALSFWRCYSRYNLPIRFGEVMKLRLASYIVQALFAAFTEMLTVLYLFRRHRVPVLAATSSGIFVYFLETYNMVLALSICLVMVPPLRGFSWLGPTLIAVCVAAWAFLLLWLLYWHTGLRRRLWPTWQDRKIFTAFAQARLWHYPEIWLYRLLTVAASVWASIWIFRSMGVTAPTGLLVAAVPVIINSTYWPVSAGGVGGPQLFADILLRGYMTSAQAVAWSLIWSAVFLLTRTLTGVFFIRPVWRAAFQPESKNADD
ncbi:MAG: hypothetical protein A2V67_14375 [Deltaproteobacteria bacterium RBG_13_61_14]|nr:MAG: hypothetical protein A2V67_14375 [Deltaproteobacteria bacterium RBG_13_61_14]